MPITTMSGPAVDGLSSDEDTAATGGCMARCELPAVTTDVQRAIHDLEVAGCALLSGVLDGERLERARAAVYRGRDEDRELKRTSDFALDYGARNVRVWNLPARDAVFMELVEDPVAIELIEAVIGWPALLGNQSANITEPGGEGGMLHADQIFVPEPWPERPQGMNIAWCLDDFSVENGATQVVPGSHRIGRNPRPEDAEDAMPIEVPAGTMMVFESRVWHRTGENRSADATRAGIFGWYTRPIYRTQENWFLTLPPEITETASERLLTLLGWRSEGLGLVYGRSPR